MLFPDLHETIIVAVLSANVAVITVYGVDRSAVYREYKRSKALPNPGINRKG